MSLAGKVALVAVDFRERACLHTTRGGIIDNCAPSTPGERAQIAVRERRVAEQTHACGKDEKEWAAAGYRFLATKPSTIELNSGVPKETYSARLA